MNNKNTLIALIVVLIGLITFLGGYLIAEKRNLLSKDPGNFGSGTANISNLNRFSSATKQNQVKNEPRLSRLTTVRAADPVISEDGKNVLYTEKGTKKIFSTDFSGQNNSFVKTEEVKPANESISGTVLSKNKQKIAYLFSDKNSGEGQISIANPDGSVFKNILPTRARQLKLAWVNDHRISFYDPKEEDHSLFLLNLENRQLEKVLDSLNSLKVLWSPDGSKLFYSYQEAGEQKAVLLDLLTKEQLAIDLATEADRCVWTMNSLFVYCGSPAVGSEQVSDSLYQLDIAKKEFGLTFQPSSVDQIKIKKPFLSPAEDYLFFVNDFDGYLYKISL